MHHAMKPFVISFVLLIAATRPGAAQDTVMIPVSTHDAAATAVIRLEGFVYKPGGTGKFPVVIFSHGAAGGSRRVTEPAAEIAQYYVSHGFAVVVAMRRGRGKSEGQCPRDFNYLSFEQFGHQTATPMLWLYGDHDLFNSTASIRSYVKAFQVSGGNARFVLIPNVPENGHWLPRHLDLWRRPTDEYLATLGLRGR